ncbi:MAG: ABC transporter ATP-binding protein [Lentisphaeria bacterium]|nr:ABC transporter ATP-binding protein [Lentisphaeria bacterium]
MIITEHLTKDFGGGRGVHDLSLNVEDNSIFGFIGPNGSGKSTTIKILCGLYRADTGNASINGLPVIPKNQKKIKSLVGYLPDEFGVYDQMTVWEYLDFFCAAYKINGKKRRTRIGEVLEITGANHMVDYQVNSLSRGMHQKIGIAKTLLHDPMLLILDEPANGLDPHARIDMRDTILRLKELGKTILLSSHILSELGAICDDVGIIEKGRLITKGTVEEISRSLQQNLTIELNVDNDLDECVELLQQIDQVEDIRTVGAGLEFQFNGRREEISDINHYLIQQGMRVLGIGEAEFNLENVFLTVTETQTGHAYDSASKTKSHKVNLDNAEL